MPAKVGIFSVIPAYNNKVRAGFQRFEHGHGRFHAIKPCIIAGRRDNAASSAANNNGFMFKRGIVTFLNGAIKGIAIDMGDG